MTRGKATWSEDFDPFDSQRDAAPMGLNTYPENLSSERYTLVI